MDNHRKNKEKRRTNQKDDGYGHGLGLNYTYKIQVNFKGGLDYNFYRVYTPCADF